MPWRGCFFVLGSVVSGAGVVAVVGFTALDLLSAGMVMVVGYEEGDNLAGAVKARGRRAIATVGSGSS